MPGKFQNHEMRANHKMIYCAKRLSTVILALILMFAALTGCMPLHQYTTRGSEDRTVRQLEQDIAAARQSRARILERRELVEQDIQQLDASVLAADCIEAQARLELSLRQGRCLLSGDAQQEDILRWCAYYPATLGAWKDARDRHRSQMRVTGFPASLSFVNGMIFDSSQADAYVEMGNLLAGKIMPGKLPYQVALPFLDNPGPPYRRGLVHGRAFRNQIAQACRDHVWPTRTKASPGRRESIERMKEYVTLRFPAIMRELQGIADGSQLSLDEIFWLNSFNAVWYIPDAPKCSSIILRGQDGSVAMAKTSDINERERKVMLMRRVRDRAVDFYAIGWVGTVWVEMGQTRSGLTVGASSAPVQPNQTGYGIPQHFGAYPVLFEASTVQEAIAAFSRFDFAGKGLVYGLVDARGGTAILDKTGTLQGVRGMGSDALLGVNLFESDTVEKYFKNLPKGNSSNSLGRKKRFERWLAERDQTRSPAPALLDLIADQEGEGAFCQTGQGYVVTEAATIHVPGKGEIWTTGLAPSKRAYIKWRFDDK
jgi:cell division protein FtsB